MLSRYCVTVLYHGVTTLYVVTAISQGVLAASSPSKAPVGTANIAVAAQGGLLKDVGVLNPHAYRPNEVFAQNWVYEGLVRYGPGGKILPALAESWDVRPPAEDGSQDIVFTLRRGTTFHDGAEWTAHVAKANLDNILIEPLKSNYHGWYDFTEQVKAWKVLDDFTLVLTFKSSYYPALQELTLIRPIRFLSPNCLPSAANEKSCPPSAQTTDFWPIGETPTFKCVGIKCAIGTGPLKFVKKVTSTREVDATMVTNATTGETETVKEIHFERYSQHWDKSAGGNVDSFVLKIYSSLESVAAAVQSGDIDMVFGLDTINPHTFRDLHLKDDDHLQTFISEPLTTRYIMFNTMQPPTDSLAVRRAIIHAIDKGDIINNVLAGLEVPAYTLFPKNMPYCDVNLSPLLSYDADKATLLLSGAGWALDKAGRRSKDKKALDVSFLFRTSNAIQLEIEDDIVKHLGAVGIGVTSIPAPDNDVFNSFNNNGSYNLAISALLGAPYDPHTTLNYLKAQPFNTSFKNMSAKDSVEGYRLSEPMNKAELDDLVGLALVSKDVSDRQKLYRRILTAIHEQALFYPLSYQVNIAVLDHRYENFEFGSQQHDWPVHMIVDKRKLEKAATRQVIAGKRNSGLSKGAIAAIAVCSVVMVTSVALVVFLAVRERAGRPVFMPLVEDSVATGKRAGIV